MTIEQELLDKAEMDEVVANYLESFGWEALEDSTTVVEVQTVIFEGRDFVKKEIVK